MCLCLFFFFQAEDGIRDLTVTGVQTCALPIWSALRGLSKPSRWRFFVKNSETEISRWRAPISTAEAVVAGLAGLASGVLASAAFGSAAGVLAVAASGFALDLAFDLSLGLGFGAGLDLTPP